MDKEDRDVIQVTKEIVIKFIETQRISPANFPEMFPAIYDVVRRTCLQDAAAKHGQGAGATVPHSIQSESASVANGDRQ